MDRVPVDRHRVVSFEDENLILVDERDTEIGNLPKDKCHDGAGRLHRAFSLFIFNRDGDVLLQQRSGQKRLWPMYWSNACCSHPRRGEDMETAISRRLRQELGLSSELRFLFKFIYHARYDKTGSERELCWVYLGRSQGEVIGNTNEVADWRFISVPDLNKALAEDPESYTPWMKLEWNRIQEQHPDQLAAFSSVSEAS